MVDPQRELEILMEASSILRFQSNLSVGICLTLKRAIEKRLLREYGYNAINELDQADEEFKYILKSLQKIAKRHFKKYYKHIRFAALNTFYWFDRNEDGRELRLNLIDFRIRKLRDELYGKNIISDTESRKRE